MKHECFYILIEQKLKYKRRQETFPLVKKNVENKQAIQKINGKGISSRAVWRTSTKKMNRLWAIWHYLGNGGSWLFQILQSCLLYLLTSIIPFSGNLILIDHKNSHNTLDQLPLRSKADFPILWICAALVTGFDEQNAEEEMVRSLGFKSS